MIPAQNRVKSFQKYVVLSSTTSVSPFKNVYTRNTHANALTIGRGRWHGHAHREHRWALRVHSRAFRMCVYAGVVPLFAPTNNRIVITRSSVPRSLTHSLAHAARKNRDLKFRAPMRAVNRRVCRGKPIKMAKQCARNSRSRFRPPNFIHEQKTRCRALA